MMYYLFVLTLKLVQTILLHFSRIYFRCICFNHFWSSLERLPLVLPLELGTEAQDHHESPAHVVPHGVEGSHRLRLVHSKHTDSCQTGMKNSEPSIFSGDLNNEHLNNGNV